MTRTPLVVMASMALLFVLMAVSIVFTVRHHRFYARMEAQRTKDFNITKDAAKSIKRPEAVITNNNHFMLVTTQGKLIVYCISENECVFGAGVTRDTIARAVDGLFSDLATQHRAQVMQKQQDDAIKAQQMGIHIDGRDGHGNVSTTGPNSVANTGNNNSINVSGYGNRTRGNSVPASSGKANHKPAPNREGVGNFRQESHGANSPNISGAGSVNITNR